MASCKGIPTGITTLGTKVVVIPGFASGLTHSAGIRTTYDEGSYCWLNKGDPIGEIYIDGSMSDNIVSRLFQNKEHSASVISPESGLLLHSTLDTLRGEALRDWNTMQSVPQASIVLLLSHDNEDSIETSKFVYGNVCRLIRNMSHYYFKDSRQWSMGAFIEEELNEMIEMQLNAAPRVFDAMPNWKGYIEEARNKRPDLKPHLKHLV